MFGNVILCQLEDGVDVLEELSDSIFNVKQSALFLFRTFTSVHSTSIHRAETLHRNSITYI
jgi:hypothetical protein